MKKDYINEFDYDDELFDDFGELGNDGKSLLRKQKCEPIHSDNWTIVDAFNAINEELPKSQLNNELFVKCAEPFVYLHDVLGFNPVQCAIIAMLVENGQPMSFRQFGKILGLSRLSMMTHYNEIEELYNARWLLHRGAKESDGIYAGYGLVKGVVGAIRENKPFAPEILECEDTQTFVDKLSAHIAAGFNDENLLFDDEKDWIMDLIKANETLPICKTAMSLSNIDSIALLMVIIADYCNYNGSRQEGIGPQEVRMVYPRGNNHNFHQIAAKMQGGTHELFQKGLIEHKCEDGMADVNTYVATSYLKDEILAEFSPMDHSDKVVPKFNGLKASKDITPKELFYNKKEGEQVERLQTLLSQEQLPIVQERLAKSGMRTGVCILMYGAPGTGKTATAYELARQTGRDIIQVQVTDFKDKYIGESEAKLKKIFANYRRYCQNSKVTPILLLNEGDAILSKRTTNIERSVDQMSNTLQNILLEEMENLEGIMIVTTNLTVNLDTAFERRFIFKIEFQKPDKEVKARIWKSMIGDLDTDDSMELAGLFDISGGEIENIARKTIMEYAITGNKPDLAMVKAFAKEEKLKTNTRPIVGFSSQIQ